MRTNRVQAVNLDVSGISTFAAGVNITGIVTATQAIVGSAVTVNSTGINVVGVVTATSFSGNGANLTGLPEGITVLKVMLFA